MDKDNRLYRVNAARSEKRQTALDVSIRLAMLSGLLGACNVRGFVDPVNAAGSESPTFRPSLSLTTPEHTQTLTKVPTKSAEAKSSTSTTREAEQTQVAGRTQVALSKTPPPYTETIIAPDLTDTPTIVLTKTETPTPTPDLAAVIELVEKKLTIWNATGGGVILPEVTLSFSFEGLDKTPTVEIPEKLGGGKILWEIQMLVYDQEIGVIMAKVHPDGTIPVMSARGKTIGLDLTRVHIRKVFGEVEGKTCISSLSISTDAIPYNDDWEPTVKPQKDWRDMFFVGSDGKKHVLVTDFMCKEIQP